MSERPRSEHLVPGTVLRHTTETLAVVGRRKTAEEAGEFPGWWLREIGGGEAGGLADFVFDAPGSEWSIAEEPGS